MTRLTSSTLAIALLLVLAGTAARPGSAQVLSVLTPQPVAPGGFVQVQIFNDTGATLSFDLARHLHLIAPDGDTRQPVFLHGDVFTFTTVAAGATGTFGFFAPPAAVAPARYLVLATGFASNFATELRSYDVLDVGGAGAAGPLLFAHPTRMLQAFTSRDADFAGGAILWDLASVSGVSQTLGGSDRIEVRTPGAALPVFSLALAGLTVPAQKRLSVAVPTAGLAPGPHEVWTFLTDPVTSVQRAIPYGIQAPGTGIDLHLPAGRALAPGGALEVRLAMSGFATLPNYLVLFALNPGATFTAAGLGVPVSLGDPLLALALSGALSALVPGQAGVGQPVGPLLLYNGQSFSTPIQILHPGPGYAGLTLRVLAVAVDGTGLFGTSQGEIATIL